VGVCAIAPAATAKYNKLVPRRESVLTSIFIGLSPILKTKWQLPEASHPRRFTDPGSTLQNHPATQPGRSATSESDPKATDNLLPPLDSASIPAQSPANPPIFARSWPLPFCGNQVAMKVSAAIVVSDRKVQARVEKWDFPAFFVY
jgi:hypothetical protein